jgi:membrane protease YdiL (CAAX protease family)
LEDFSQEDIEVAVVVSYTLLASVAMWALTTVPGFIGLFERRYGQSTGNVRHIFTSRLLSALIMGVPLTVFALVAWGKTPRELGLTVPADKADDILWVALASIPLIVAAVYPASKKTAHHQVYPTIRRMDWTRWQVFTYVMSWGIYLVGYEILYRGVLFFVLLDHMGVLAASAITVVIYAATHAYKGFAEVFGSIAAGAVICAVAWHTESFLIGAIIHIEMSWLNFYFTFRARRKYREQ